MAPLVHRMQQGGVALEGNYAVMFGGQPCGKVQVLREGLYYRFICRCRLSGEVLCRLRVSCGGKQEELGILAPVDGGFGLDRKIPVKRLGEGAAEFKLYTGDAGQKETFVPIVPEEPFSYIAKLKESYLVRKDGQVGILL